MVVRFIFQSLLVVAFIFQMINYYEEDKVMFCFYLFCAIVMLILIAIEIYRHKKRSRQEITKE